jgi:hypothetical protein
LDEGTEQILNSFERVGSEEDDKPSLLNGDTGTLIVTNLRILYLKEKINIEENLDYYEERVREGLGFQINLKDIRSINSDSHKLINYIRVEHGDVPRKVHCFWPSGGGSQDQVISWVNDIFDPLKEIRKTGEGGRDLVFVDESHDQDDRGNLGIADILGEICIEYGLNEPDVFVGSPQDRIIEANNHLLKRIKLITSFGLGKKDPFRDETNILLEYVREGGNLFITANPPYDPPNEFLERFGVTLDNMDIKDAVNHVGRHDNHILVQDFAEHTINNGIKCIRIGDYGCYPLNISNPMIIPLAFSSKDADPPRVPIAALIPHGGGYILLVGHNRLFQDKYIEDEDNQQWLRNILSFLLSSPKGMFEDPIQRNCPQCGQPINQNDQYCGYCGEKIPENY